MAIGKLSVVVSRGDVAFSADLAREETGGVDEVVDLAAAKTGSLTARTDDDTGVVTAEAEHGITDSDAVDVYWEGDSPGVRYGMDVTIVDGNDISINLGAGDVLPALNSAVTIVKQVLIVIPDFDGDQTKFLAMHCSRRGHVDLQQVSGTSIEASKLGPTAPYVWVDGGGASNPLAGNTVSKAMATCGDSAGSGRIQIGIVRVSVT